MATVDTGTMGAEADVEVAPAAGAGDPVRDAASGAWFRARLAEVGHTKGSLSRLMQNCGDDRDRKAIARALERMAAGQARVSGEMRVLLHFLARSRAKRAAPGAKGEAASPPAAAASGWSRNPGGRRPRPPTAAAAQPR